MFKIKKWVSGILLTGIFTVFGFAQTTINVSAPELVANVGDTLEIPVTVTHITEVENVMSYNFTLSYDDAVIDVFDVNTSGTISSGTMVTKNIGFDDKIKVGMMTTSPIAGTGALIYIRAEVVGAGLSALDFDSFLFNAGNPAVQLTHGQVSVGALEVTLPETVASVGDTVLIPVNVTEISADQNVMSYNISVGYDGTLVDVIDVIKDGTISSGEMVTTNTNFTDQVKIGMMTTSPIAGTGALVYLKTVCLAKGTSALTFDSFLFNAGIPIVTTNDGQITIGSIAVDLPDDLEMNINTTQLVPVTVSSIAANDGVYSYNFSVSYDGTKLDITGVTAAGTISEGTMVTPNTNETNKISVGMMTTTPIEGNDGDVLVYLNVEAVGTGSSNLTFDDFLFNSNTPPNNTDGGNVTVINNTFPAFVGAVDSAEVDENAELVLTYDAEDVDGDPLTFVAVSIPDGAVFTVEDTTLRWTPGFDEAGVYTVIVSVTDQMAVVNDTTVVTVTNVNRVPVFDVVLSGITIAENEVFAFTYTATDPDADDITFALVDAIEGMTVSAVGELAWTPTLVQSGIHTVVVSVSDGVLAVNDTALVTVSNVNQAPVFVNVMPDTTINEEQALSYTYTATDADADELTFSLFDAPEGAAIDGSTGAFTWIPTYEQDSTYNIVAVVSDGALTDTSTAIVIVLDYTDAVTFNTLPEKFALHQNYPNPFNPTTNIQFDLPKAVDVKLVIYDIMGRKITTLVNTHMEAGYKNIVWNGTNDYGKTISSGIYIYRIIAGNNIETMKMSYIK